MPDSLTACPARGSGRLAFLGCYLTLWIYLAMAVGVLPGNVAPRVVRSIAQRSVGTIPGFEGCYKLSMAKLALESAIRNR